MECILRTETLLRNFMRSIVKLVLDTEYCR